MLEIANRNISKVQSCSTGEGGKPSFKEIGRQW
jgi:hypothetical protein